MQAGVSYNVHRDDFVGEVRRDHEEVIHLTVARRSFGGEDDSSNFLGPAGPLELLRRRVPVTAYNPGAVEAKVVWLADSSRSKLHFA